ncbi:MAG: hypothetical protein AMJ60_03710 [Desulfobacterales bacterium SG8_35]|nr:MAG: hypothetical protein AMJ60_03710 [Desulfobacterales bacterium SG8_35]
MNKETKKNNGIKDSISKLFILRDSCTGTCITQKDNPNITWFEGAAILLQQCVAKLKSGKQKMDSGAKDAAKDFSCDLQETVSKLVVLKRSWVVSRAEESAENIIWFEGAESIISEVIDQLQKTLQKTETQPVISAAPGSSKSEESAGSKTADKPEAEEDEEDEEAEKQAAAG